MQRFHDRFWCLLNFSSVSLLSVHDRDAFANKRKQKDMMLTKIDLSSINNVDIAELYFCFFDIAIEEKLR